jgi:hypothetical protein
VLWEFLSLSLLSVNVYIFSDNMVELPPLRFVRETSRSSKVNMEAIVIDIDEQEIEDVEEVKKRLEGVDDLNTEADVDELLGGEGGFPSDDEEDIPELVNNEEVIFPQKNETEPKNNITLDKDKENTIDAKKAKEEISELEFLIEKATKGDLNAEVTGPDADLEDLEFDEDMASRRRRSNSYEDTIQNMDPELLKELGLLENNGDDKTTEEAKDLASRVEDKANDLIKDSPPGQARRRSRSRSRSKPPSLDTVEENYSKEYQESLYYKQNGIRPTPLNDIQESPSGASIQYSAMPLNEIQESSSGASIQSSTEQQQGKTIDSEPKHLPDDTTNTFQNQTSTVKNDPESPDNANAVKSTENCDEQEGASAIATTSTPMSLKDEAQFDIDSEDKEKQKRKILQSGKDKPTDNTLMGEDSITRTNSIDEEMLDYEISDSDEDISVRTVEAVMIDSPLSGRKSRSGAEGKATAADGSILSESTGTKNKRAKDSKGGRKKSKSHERSLMEYETVNVEQEETLITIEDKQRSKSRDNKQIMGDNQADKIVQKSLEKTGAANEADAIQKDQKQMSNMDVTIVEDANIEKSRQRSKSRDKKAKGVNEPEAQRSAKEAVKIVTSNEKQETDIQDSEKGIRNDTKQSEKQRERSKSRGKRTPTKETEKQKTRDANANATQESDISGTEHPAEHTKLKTKKESAEKGATEALNDAISMAKNEIENENTTIALDIAISKAKKVVEEEKEAQSNKSQVQENKEDIVVTADVTDNLEISEDHPKLALKKDSKENKTTDHPTDSEAAINKTAADDKEKQSEKKSKTNNLKKSTKIIDSDSPIGPNDADKEAQKANEEDSDNSKGKKKNLDGESPLETEGGRRNTDADKSNTVQSEQQSDNVIQETGKEKAKTEEPKKNVPAAAETENKIGVKESFRPNAESKVGNKSMKDAPEDQEDSQESDATSVKKEKEKENIKKETDEKKTVKFTKNLEDKKNKKEKKVVKITVGEKEKEEEGKKTVKGASQKAVEENKIEEDTIRKTIEETSKKEEHATKNATFEKKEQDTTKAAEENKREVKATAKKDTEEKTKGEALAKKATEEKKKEETGTKKVAQEIKREESVATEMKAEEKKIVEAPAKKAEEEKKEEESVANKAAEDKKKDKDTAAKKVTEEKKKVEAEAKKAAEEKKKEEEATAKKVTEEKKKMEADAKKATEEKKKEEEEATAKKAAEEKKKEEESAKKAAEEKKKKEAAAKKATEEKKKEEAAAAKKTAEEKTRNEEADAKKAAEEKKREQAAAKKAAEEKKKEEVDAKKAAEEKKKGEAANKKAAEEKKKKEEADVKKAAEEKTKVDAYLKKASEEKKKKEEADAKKAVEEKKRGEAATKKAAEEKKKEEVDAKKAAEEKKKKEEADAKKATEEKKKEEAATKKAAEEKKKNEEADLKKAAEEKKKVDADAKKASEEKKKKEEADAKKAAEEKKKEEAAAKKAAEEKKKEEAAAKKATEDKKKEEAAAKKSAEDKKKEEAAAKKAAVEMKKKEEAAAKIAAERKKVVEASAKKTAADKKNKDEEEAAAKKEATEKKMKDEEATVKKATEDNKKKQLEEAAKVAGEKNEEEAVTKKTIAEKKSKEEGALIQNANVDAKGKAEQVSDNEDKIMTDAQGKTNTDRTAEIKPKKGIQQNGGTTVDKTYQGSVSGDKTSTGSNQVEGESVKGSRIQVNIRGQRTEMSNQSETDEEIPLKITESTNDSSKPSDRKQRRYEGDQAKRRFHKTGERPEKRDATPSRQSKETTASGGGCSSQTSYSDNTRKTLTGPEIMGNGKLNIYSYFA